MSWPQRGQLFQLGLEGARAELVVVLSEDDWNQYTRDCVIVPFFRDSVAHESVIRPRLNDDLIADCTVVTSLAQSDLGNHSGDCTPSVLAAVGAGVRTYFGIDEILEPPRVRPRVGGRSSWWPRQGDICLAPRIAPDSKWTAIVSEDSSNVVFDHAVAARLTSTTSKQRRRRWEVPVSGGFAIANDLHAIPYSAFEPRPGLAPPLSRLSGTEMRGLATRLVETLGLDSPAVTRP